MPTVQLRVSFQAVPKLHMYAHPNLWITHQERCLIADADEVYVAQVWPVNHHHSVPDHQLSYQSCIEFFFAEESGPNLNEGLTEDPGVQLSITIALLNHAATLIR